MPNIESVLKTEIARRARKQVQAEVESLKKAASQQRTHLASLRREVEALERAVKKLSKDAGTASRAPGESSNSGDERALRF